MWSSVPLQQWFYVLLATLDVHLHFDHCRRQHCLGSTLACLPVYFWPLIQTVIALRLLPPLPRPPSRWDSLRERREEEWIPIRGEQVDWTDNGRQCSVDCSDDCRRLLHSDSSSHSCSCFLLFRLVLAQTPPSKQITTVTVCVFRMTLQVK